MRKCKGESDRTRQRLLDAAEQVFSDKGYGAAALEEVADLAGLTRGSIYWHFRGKPDLLGAVIDRARLPWDELPRRADADGVSDISELAEGMAEGIKLTVADPHLRRVSLILLQGSGPPAQRRRTLLRLRRIQARLCRYLLTVIEGEQPGVSAAAHNSQLARHISTFMLGALYEALMLDAPVDSQRVGRDVRDFILGLPKATG
ncbi:TetR family transcriptional regulator [Pseudomonas denitrificans (nom. rej.)]|uniref:TetR family transcriptional regulator n=1 Tax=Pseudomonas denitrificans TaxID=43306 RepID=A0A9X7MZ54_PSEDE|nr:TetR family transcriptional regulator [Pseudomonas denitrificans (nom. rej.)]QEY72048.1 TetR family transcriptional regulator [Pseudomonas denitrificans (nom. rej.)]